MQLAYPDTANHFYTAHVRMLLQSYQDLLGKPLAGGLDPDDPNIGEKVFAAGFPLLSHNAEADPKFNYANRAGLQLFEYRWEELMGLPSRFSAEPEVAANREQLLAEVTANGYIENYSGVRIAKSGKRFKIEDATVWNVSDPDGVYCGQAARITSWVVLP